MSRLSDFDPAAARSTPPVAALPDRACADPVIDPRIFYPPPGGPATAAREVCARCPHRQPCLDWAVETRQTHGIWGGTTAVERWRMTQEAP